MSVMEVFSKRLHTLRESAGLSQTQLAEKLGVSRGSISYYENGDRVPDIEFLYNLSSFFDVPYDFLLGNKPDDKHPLEDRLSLSSEAISAIEVLSRTIDIKSGLSMADVLNALLLNTSFADLLLQIEIAANISEQEARELSELGKSRFGMDIEPTVEASRRLREVVILSSISKMIDELKQNPIDSCLTINPTNDGGIIIKAKADKGE